MKNWLASVILLFGTYSTVGLATEDSVHDIEARIAVNGEHDVSRGTVDAAKPANAYLQALVAMAGAVVDTLLDSDPAQDNVAANDGAEDIPATDAQTVEVDPFEKYNRVMFRFNNRLDDLALRPLAENYREYTPAIVRQGVRNFFSNIGDVGVLANSALQGKFEQAFWDTSRLTINSVAGLGGVIDVATMFDIKKNNEDFGQTFGVWGIPEGPYIVLPVLGPRTMRSAVGTAVDTYIQMEALGAVSEVAAGQDLVTEMLSLNIVNQREGMLGKKSLLEEAAIDPYVFTREAYLAYRRCQVEDCDKIDYTPASPEAESKGTEEEPMLDEIDMLDELD